MTSQPHRRTYLDYNATAPLLPEAAGEMKALLDGPGGEFANPSSPHRFGQEARAALETMRARLAGVLGCHPREVIYTSGGSEANNMILRHLVDGGPGAHLITSPQEHPSIMRCAEWLRQRGVAVSYLPLDGRGVVETEALAGLLRPETRLVSVMAANNETGVVQPLKRLAAALRKADPEGRVMLHSDAVQALGRIDLSFGKWGLDAITLAAHKLGGPKGIGALVVRENRAVPPLILGGGQERGRRAGTESVVLATGFSAAAEWTAQNMQINSTRMAGLRDGLEQGLAGVQGFYVNGAEAPRLPNTTSLGFAGVSAVSLLVALDLDGIAVSTGSACSSGALEPSHVLRAMDVGEDRLAGSLRISLGYRTSDEDIRWCVERLRHHVERLRG
ncbi:MAG: cysteine desulfurase [Deltaproteobacteria bacterium]|nr:cysteine desulfurase [Deltaproteobacteria bacterium]